MHTELADFLQGTRDGERAREIIGACVHCGFCSATCPTYQLLGDERDSPRGRIYLIKQVLEGQTASASTQLHLDRCLTCRNCESTCPSGVEYGQLIDIGRRVVDAQVKRPFKQQAVRQTLLQVLPRPGVVTPLLKIGQALRPVLPAVLQNKLTKPRPMGRWPAERHAQRMLLLDGCVQPGMAPNINAATARVFDALEISLVRAGAAGCCGALRLHMGQHEAALADMRQNIDAWWPYLEQGIDTIVMTASGCGVTVKDYGQLLAHDPAYAAKAARVAGMTRDVSEVLADRVPALAAALATTCSGQAQASAEKRVGQRVAYHPPCTLQHGQQLKGIVEGLLTQLGVTVHLPQDSHLCCGSAGTYSVLQPVLATRLRDNKLANLAAAEPTVILSGNIGCLTHLQTGTETPVMHWMEWLDQMLGQR